jgi:hypothetical protein
MKIKANDLFESYVRGICNSQAQFEAVNKLHKLYFESQMDAEVEIEDCECCDTENCECNGGDCEDVKCTCDKGLNESVGEDGSDIAKEAEKNGLTVPEYKAAFDMFVNN